MVMKSVVTTSNIFHPVTGQGCCLVTPQAPDYHSHAVTRLFVTQFNYGNMWCERDGHLRSNGARCVYRARSAAPMSSRVQRARVIEFSRL